MRCLLLALLLPAFAVAQQPASQVAAPPAVAKPTPLEAATAKLRDWAQLGFYQAENAALGSAAPGRVVFFGDSITYGWGRNGNEFFPGKPYVNRGISGQTTPQMLVRFRQDVISLHPSTVVILAGTNDIAGNTGPETMEQIEDNLRSMAELGRANNIRVIFSSVLPAADYPWKPGLAPAQKIVTLNQWLEGYCKLQNLTYLDYYPALATPEGGMKAELARDGVHPTPAGYAVMAPLALAAINKK